MPGTHAADQAWLFAVACIRPVGDFFLLPELVNPSTIDLFRVIPCQFMGNSNLEPLVHSLDDNVECSVRRGRVLLIFPDSPIGHPCWTSGRCIESNIAIAHAKGLKVVQIESDQDAYRPFIAKPRECCGTDSALAAYADNGRVVCRRDSHRVVDLLEFHFDRLCLTASGTLGHG